MTRTRDELALELEYVKGVRADLLTVRDACEKQSADLSEAWNELGALIPAAIVAGEGEHVTQLSHTFAAIGASTIAVMDTIGSTLHLLTGRLHMLMAEATELRGDTPA